MTWSPCLQYRKTVARWGWEAFCKQQLQGFDANQFSRTHLERTCLWMHSRKRIGPSLLATLKFLTFSSLQASCSQENSWRCEDSTLCSNLREPLTYGSAPGSVNFTDCGVRRKHFGAHARARKGTLVQQSNSLVPRHPYHV